MLYTCRKCGWQGAVSSRPRCLPCYATASKAWRANNPEKRKAQKARWLASRIAREPGYSANRKRIRRANNPESVKRSYEQRKAWLASGNVTAAELRDIYDLAEGKCHYCQTSVKSPRFIPSDPRGFDHITSRANGGNHEKANLVCCCWHCNSLKSSK